MEFEFRLKKMKEVVAKVRHEHPLKGESFLYSPSRELEELVNRIVDSQPEKLKQNIISLTNKQISMLAGYIPHNYYDVKLDNLFFIFSYRSSLELCESLYSQWQNAYDNSDCNRFFAELARKNEHCKELLEKYQMDQVFFAKLMRDEIPPVLFGKRVSSELAGIELPLEDKVKTYGIDKDSVLFRDCAFMYYTYCDRLDYCNADIERLKKVIEEYIEDDKKRNKHIFKEFLCNFLTKLDRDDLKQRTDLVPICKKQTGEWNTASFSNFFEGVGSDVIAKYRFWLSQWMIGYIFPDDPRGRFWQKYDCISVIDHRWKNQSFLMEFPEYYVIEFTEEKLGAISVVKREIFDERVWSKFKSYDAKDLKSFLYQHREDRTCLAAWMRHLPNNSDYIPPWTWNVAEKLEKLGIRQYSVKKK